MDILDGLVGQQACQTSCRACQCKTSPSLVTIDVLVDQIHVLKVRYHSANQGSNLLLALGGYRMQVHCVRIFAYI